MVDHDLRHRAIARDEHQRAGTAQGGAESLRAGLAGGTPADAGRPPPGRRYAPGQRDDLMRLLTGQKPYHLAADLPAGAGHRDPHHAILTGVRRAGPDGRMRPYCPVQRPGGDHGRGRFCVLAVAMTEVSARR